MESTNGDMPAMPMDSTSAQRADEGHYDQFSYGLTKREHFAAMAMQGFISAVGHHGLNGLITTAASDSVVMADALLAALGENHDI
tara:strand:- start:147 stop:401 length:255 start_codon:yes stop_codon:yes gene_type:complete